MCLDTLGPAEHSTDLQVLTSCIGLSLELCYSGSRTTPVLRPVLSLLFHYTLLHSIKKNGNIPISEPILELDTQANLSSVMVFLIW